VVNEENAARSINLGENITRIFTPGASNMQENEIKCLTHIIPNALKI